jgi:membrane associated rhomboid family serine protease
VKRSNSLTTSLIAVITGAYLIANYFANIIPGLPLQQRLFLIKYALLSDGQPHGIQAGEWYRYFTVALTHANLTHILFNMLALYSLGIAVESYYGVVKYGVILGFSLISASYLSNYFAASNVPAVGASGMIFGLFGAILVTGRRMGVDYRQVLGIVIVNLVITFLPGANIDWRAHLGGLAGGALITLIISGLNRPKQRLRNI